jgi:DNA-binding response OmpR family regulator
VLLIEAHADTLEMYATALRHEGYLVLEAQGGMEAFQQARTLLPSVVVTEMRIQGDVTGAVICGHFRARGVPVIVISAIRPTSADDWVHSSGCDALLMMPLAPDVLIEHIVRAVEATASRSPVSPASASSDAP